MYQYSLDYYVALFENSIKKSDAAEQLRERVTNLNDYHTYAVYENACRGLFDRHKLPFSFQICMKILTSENAIDTDEFEFLLDGGDGPKSETPVTTTPRPGMSSRRPASMTMFIGIFLFFPPSLPLKDWLPTACWDNILALSSLPGFRGADESFGRFADGWRAWYSAPDPENLELVGIIRDEKNKNDSSQIELNQT